MRQPLSTPEFVALFSLTTALTAVSIDAMLPALATIGRELDVAHANDTQLVVSLFIFGMVFGELVFGPLSDAIGRKRSILLGLAIFAAGAVVAMTATTLSQLLIGRIIQGVGVSGPKIASRALIRDCYEGDAMARMMSFIFMVFILVPMVAPAIGQLVLNVAGWRTIFVLFLALGVLVALWMGFRQPETLAPERRIPISVATIAGNAARIATHGKVMAYTVAAGFVFGANLLYISTAPAVFADLYDAVDLFPLYFALLALGFGLASFANGKLVMRHGMFRLSVTALGGLILFGGGLLAVGLAHRGVPPFALFMTLCFLLFFCIGILFGNINALAMQSLGNVAGIGASMIASVSSIVAVAIAVSIGRFYDGTVMPLALAFLLAGSVSLVLLLLARRSRSGPI